ncbi:uncharacterized protein F5891DRAFT_1182296 [Suillus fuscotomentosus]|uniref:Uncharacterized protein n=1 Tax=Suillus fuscotomentosus TaxID=1912939 RepID=A0AAD4EHD3_9AGAM|nr:uncharacterized protein F5891DRAFT_1182296 [Suillus fuscotomentosus]KAG1906107.1 hypothetical protein F5891DRAFT_1182296 [Suillus fuscotomentosus]
MAATGADSPLGSDKGQIYGGLAKTIFTDHPKYGATYSSNPKKFCDAVGSRITTQVKVSFGSMGAGVMPTERSQAKNLLDTALLELPWYKDLDTIWHSNPSMAVTILVKTGCLIMSVPCIPLFSQIVGPVPLHTLAPLSSHPIPPMFSHCIPQTYHILCPCTTPPPVPPNTNILAGGQYPPVVLQQPPPASSYPPPEVHLPGFPSDDDDAKNNFSFDRHLGDPAKDNDMILNDTSPVAGRSISSPQRHLLLQMFQNHLRYQQKLQHQHTTAIQHLGRRSPQAMGANADCHQRCHAACQHHHRLTHNTTSSLDFHMSPTPETSLPNSTSSLKKKKAKSDVLQQVGQQTPSLPRKA